MRYPLIIASVFAILTVDSPAIAADASKGKATASAVCAACHGANGVSVTAAIPNLAGQKEKYLEVQLKAFQSGARKNAMMKAVAGQLSSEAIGDVSAFFSSLPGSPSGAETSKPLSHLVSARMAFPGDYAKTFTHYTSINFANRGQVRKYFANPAATAAARDGKPMPDGSLFLVEVYKVKRDANGKPVMGSDGILEDDGKIAFYTAMEKQPGWGNDFPEILRNGDWNYGVFTAEKALKSGVNQATCLACHKPLVQDSYVFSLDKLKEVAAK